MARSGVGRNRSPYTQPDDSWISLSVTVEMDDGDRDADAYKLLPGDKVNVVGKIDDNLFELISIEASSVYVEKLGTTFYASPATKRT